MDGYDAIRALTALVETCRGGTFYEDYDASTSLIGEADAALDFLTPLFAGATALRPGAPLAVQVPWPIREPDAAPWFPLTADGGDDTDG